MVETSELDPRVHCERDAETHIARHHDRQPGAAQRVRPADAARDGRVPRRRCRRRRHQGPHPARLTGVFTTGADMANSYNWYGPDGAERRPSQRRRLGVDRESFGFYHDYLTFPKVTIAQVETYALGGGFELALMTDSRWSAATPSSECPERVCSVPRSGTCTSSSTASARSSAGDFFSPATPSRPEVEHLGLFTEVCDDDDVASGPSSGPRRWRACRPTAWPSPRPASPSSNRPRATSGKKRRAILVHAFATNLRFEDDEFNFVKSRPKHGTSDAFKLRDAALRRADDRAERP